MGAYAINGKDLMATFGIFVREGGSDGFLQLPKPKAFYQYDWKDKSGVETDPTEPVVFEPRSVAVPFTIAADTEAAFWAGYTGFIAELTKPGLQALYIEQANRIFRVKMENSSAFTRLSPIKNPVQKIVANFTITFLEPEPNLFTEPAAAPGETPADMLFYSWGYSGNPVYETDYSTLTYQFGANRDRSAPVLDFTQAANYKYLYVATPMEAPVFTVWGNAPKNYGKFPDQLFYAPVTLAERRIYISRSPVLLDKDNSSLSLG
ncbi:hypothetical protein I2I11_04230 [Pontibacter sp. 172403-2]|uniref:hypothetical protein n=1 Tax=Pontibacter rufus TaxID=2791028 RepID=UPI0018AFE385|nr:hypothetical protein [Pontibacter sp. 172403-2]MBF9252492.1 hypothetical protein [Pontibacter sp. 172403-2]